MHIWGDKDFDWKALDNAINVIDKRLRNARISIWQIKEKFGILRCYCTLGWYQFHDITHPGHVYRRYPKWLWNLDCLVGSKIISLVNPLVLYWHKKVYRAAYAEAVRLFPHIRTEILCMADYDELLEGL